MSTEDGRCQTVETGGSSRIACRSPSRCVRAQSRTCSCCVNSTTWWRCATPSSSSQHLFGAVPVGVHGHLVEQQGAALARPDELLGERHPQQEVHLLGRADREPVRVPQPSARAAHLDRERAGIHDRVGVAAGGHGGKVPLARRRRRRGAMSRWTWSWARVRYCSVRPRIRSRSRTRASSAAAARPAPRPRHRGVRRGVLGQFPLRDDGAPVELLVLVAQRGPSAVAPPSGAAGSRVGGPRGDARPLRRRAAAGRPASRRRAGRPAGPAAPRSAPAARRGPAPQRARR